MKKIDKEKLAESLNEAKEIAMDTAKEAEKLAGETVKEAKKIAKTTSKRASKVTKDVTATAKKTAKRSYTKLALKETYIQFMGKEYKETEVLEKIQEAYVAEGNKVTSIKSLSLYIKPEEGKAYYVINESLTGSVDL